MTVAERRRKKTEIALCSESVPIMASPRGSNKRISSKKNNQSKILGRACRRQDGATTIEAIEDQKAFYSGDSTLGTSKAAPYKDGTGTTTLSSIGTELSGNQETWCIPTDKFHSSSFNSVRSLPDDEYNHGNNTSKNTDTLQHTQCQRALNDGSSIYVCNEASHGVYLSNSFTLIALAFLIRSVQQCPHIETMQNDRSRGDPSQQQSHELLGDLTNETTHLIGLPCPHIMQPTSGDFERYSTESCPETFGRGLSSEYSFEFGAQEICGYLTPPVQSSDYCTLSFEIQDEEPEENQTHQQQRATKSEQGHSVKPEPEPPLESTPKIAAKRLASGHDSDGENSRLPKQSKISEDIDETNQRSLACPFYKHDINKYHDCSQNLLRRIKDVKQHVFRKHRKPDFYCPVCFKIFNEAVARDAHIQDRGCVAEPVPVYDGISEEQKKTLSQYPSRGKTIETQWNDMWYVIFPKDTAPRSPYLGNYREEMIPLVRDLWNKKRDQIISSVFINTACIDQHIPFISSLMEKIFDLLELESSQWTPPKGVVNHCEPKVETSPPQTDDGASDVCLNAQQQLLTNFLPQLGMNTMFQGGNDETNEGSTSELLWADTRLDVMGSGGWGPDFSEQF